MSQSRNNSCSSLPLCSSSFPHCVDEGRSKNKTTVTETTFAFVSEPSSMVDPHHSSWLSEIENGDDRLKELLVPLEKRSPLTNIIHRDVSAHLEGIAPAQPPPDAMKDVWQEIASGREEPASPRLTACVLRDAPEKDVVEAIYRMQSIKLPFPVTWARRLPEEPSADPSMLGSQEIFNHRLVYDDEDNKIEYFPFNLGLVKADSTHEKDKHNSVSLGEGCGSQSPTPTLSEDESSATLRDMSPATPSDVDDHKAAVSKRRLDKGKQRGAPQLPSPDDHPIPTRSSCKRKAKCEDDVTESSEEEVPQKSITTQSEGISGDEKKRRTRKRAATKDKSIKRPGDVLSAEFLRYRFDIKGSSNDTHSCPFPPSMALQKGICNAVFDQKAIRRHISNHVNAFKKEYSGQLLSCPFGGGNCGWDEKEPTDHVDPNSGLARHVVQVHLNTDELVCVCGNTICRGDRGHIARHLRTDGHKAKLEEEQKMDPNLQYYPDIDDEELLEEEREWLEQKKNIHAVEDDNREEGSSSRPAKRHRAK